MPGSCERTFVCSGTILAQALFALPLLQLIFANRKKIQNYFCKTFDVFKIHAILNNYYWYSLFFKQERARIEKPPLAVLSLSKVEH